MVIGHTKEQMVWLSLTSISKEGMGQMDPLMVDAIIAEYTHFLYNRKLFS